MARSAHATSSKRSKAPALTSTKSQVVLDRPIKALGVHDVKIALHPEVAVTVKVNVARSPEEADLQAQGVDVMAQMFEQDTAGFTEEFEAGAEPGIPAAAENPATPEEAEVGTKAEDEVQPEPRPRPKLVPRAKLKPRANKPNAPAARRENWAAGRSIGGPFSLRRAVGRKARWRHGTGLLAPLFSAQSTAGAVS